MQPIRIPEFAIGDAIPRQLFQTFSLGTLPPALARNVAELRASNPGWAYRLFDEAERRAFILLHYGRGVAALYDRIGQDYGAARADLFRYLLLYKEGGVYLDVKSRFTRPIDDAVRGDEGVILSQWRNGPGDRHEGWGLHPELSGIAGGEFQQWHIIAAPGHPFLRATIQKVLKGIQSYSVRSGGVGWKGVLGVTGPVAYTLAIAPLLDRHPHRRIRNEAEIGLEYSIFEGSGHKTLFAAHYTENLTPVIRQPGVRGYRDRLHVYARRRRERWRTLRRSLFSAIG